MLSPMFQALRSLFLPLLIAFLFGRILTKNQKGLNNRRISKNFTLDELIHTSTGLENIPNESQIKNLVYVVENFLQPLRDALGSPIIVTSGFRSKAVNSAIGGAPSSQHLKGEAIDFASPRLKNEELIDLAKELGLPFDQLIDEQLYNSKGIRRNWIHVSLKRTGNRKQLMTARNTPSDLRTKYSYV